MIRCWAKPERIRRRKAQEATGDVYLDGAAQNVFSSFYIQFIQNTNKLVLFINIHTLARRRPLSGIRNMVDPVRIISKDWPPSPPPPPAWDYNPRRHSERIKALEVCFVNTSFISHLLSGVQTIKCWSSWDFSLY